MKNSLKSSKPKICFVSLSSYPLLKDMDLGYIGGAEIQQVEIARELKKRGYKISFITYGNYCNNNESFDEIKIFFAYERNHVKDYSILKKAYYIYKKMKEIDADVYYYRAGSPGIIPLFVKLLNKKIILHIASDAQITSIMINTKNKIEGILAKIGNWLDIKLSDVIISQNKYQKLLLKDKFKIESIIVNNAFNLPPYNINYSKKNYLLWVGTIRSIKQPELFIEIAKQFPEYKCLLIGGIGESPELFEKIKNKSNLIDNLEFKGFVPHNKMFSYYENAILLVNTSKIEGFPNVFLEAWMHYVPVVSLNVDPNGIISKYQLGYCSKTIKKMFDNIKTILDDNKLLKTLGENGRRYIEENHDIKKIVDQYENIIISLIDK